MKRTVAVVALACALAVACGSTPDQPTITAAKALTQVDNYLHQTLTTAMKSATFTKTTSTDNDTSSCVATGTDSGFTGQVTAQVVYETSTANADLGALRTYWTNQGYTVSGGSTYLDAYTKDNYHLSAIYHADQHKLDVAGSSPCVWPTGTSPAPTS
ncbi:MAG TPA: hypothetical protein VGN81_36435 [Pseudonocardiaceae bacterium]